MSEDKNLPRYNPETGMIEGCVAMKDKTMGPVIHKPGHGVRMLADCVLSYSQQDMNLLEVVTTVIGINLYGTLEALDAVMVEARADSERCR